VLLGVAASVASSAEGLLAPSWRGAANTTYQDWRFDTSAPTAAPEVFANPYGAPTASVVVGGFGSGWLAQLEGLGSKSGYWDLGSGGAITLSMPNHVDPDMCKYVWLQVTCYKDISHPPAVGVSGASMLWEHETISETVSTGGWWVVEHSIWRMPQSPSVDTATITASVQWGSVVDEVVADTISLVGYDSLELALAQPDGTLIEINGQVVTRKFESFFYLEDAVRLRGLRVNCPVEQLPNEGTMPWVIGTLGTVDGERVLEQATVVPGSAGIMPNPYGLNHRSAASGIVPRQLLVRLWGRVSVPGPRAGTFLLCDGALQPLVVELHGVSAPTDGSYVSLTGIFGSDSGGPVIRVNSSGPMNTWQ